jgi:ABC-type glycerol-3-phosphate transport system substrate-binding protein
MLFYQILKDYSHALGAIILALLFSTVLAMSAPVKGKIYRISHANSFNMAWIFLMGLAKVAGLSPEQNPQTWDEFDYRYQKLTSPNKPIQGPHRLDSEEWSSPTGFIWLHWMQSPAVTIILMN